MWSEFVKRVIRTWWPVFILIGLLLAITGSTGTPAIPVGIGLTIVGVLLMLLQFRFDKQK